MAAGPQLRPVDGAPLSPALIDAQLLFLPGASGSTAFWQPLAERLTHPAERRFLGWPGFGPTPPDPAINSLTDLVDLVSGALDRPSALIAQSMGGVIALLTALKQPQSITHLVLIATSGGLAMAEHGAEDWRPAFMASQASVPPGSQTPLRTSLPCSLRSVCPPCWCGGTPIRSAH